MWILDNGIWLDIGIWDDADVWQDYPVGGVIVAADAGSYALAGSPATLQIAPAEAPVFGGGGGIARRERPHPVEGIGYGILPPLTGEAFGVVGIVGAGSAQLPGIKGLGTGAAGVEGRSIAQLTVKAVAVGDRGNAGRAVGRIAAIKAAGIAHHDDDEAVALSFLLDA